jgi:hypothetical protein
MIILPIIDQVWNSFNLRGNPNTRLISRLRGNIFWQELMATSLALSEKYEKMIIKVHVTL